MTIKTLEELNLEFMEKEYVTARPPYENEAHEKVTGLSTDAEPIAEQPRKVKRSAFNIMTRLLLYAALLALLFSAVTASKYSFYNVLTSSMRDEIPKGSLILVHQTDPRELEVGDNITFMRDWKTSVTHKIVAIYEDHQNSGARGFQTRGINNISDDSEIVHAENVVGKVVFTIPVVGTVVSWLVENIYIIFIIFVLCVIFPITIHTTRRRRRVKETVIRQAEN